MIYQFECMETGVEVELDMSPDDVPGWGEIIQHEDRHLKRLPGNVNVKMGFNGGGSVQVAKWHPDAPRHDAKGFPVFNNSRERSEFIARNNDRVGFGPKVEAE